MPNPNAQVPLQTPVALFCFNRPAATATVLDALRKVQPRRLFLVADGPRDGVAGEAELCAETRAVFDAIDWECDITTNFAPANLGAKGRFDTGLTWIFDQVERAIILEDDCVPGIDFFPYCEALLDRFAGDDRVWSIGGSQHFPGAFQGDESYYFSRYPMIWGWATWRRAWQQHDPEMRAWPAARDAGWLQGEFADEASQRYWAYILELTYRDRHAWDYGFYFSAWHRGAVHIHPGVNLVRNIGFGPGATHTHDERDPLANLPIESLAWPLRHPTEVLRNAVMDGRYEQTEYGGNLTRLLTQARQRARLAGSNHAI